MDETSTIYWNGWNGILSDMDYDSDNKSNTELLLQKRVFLLSSQNGLTHGVDGGLLDIETAL